MVSPEKLEAMAQAIYEGFAGREVSPMEWGLLSAFMKLRAMAAARAAVAVMEHSQL